jgi:cell volume regulation protein A
VTVPELDVALLTGSAVVIVAIVAVQLSARLGLPTLLLYMGLGMLLGEDAVGIDFDDANLTRVLGYAALVLILAEGGLTTSWRNIRGTVPAAVSLATVGVVISMAVTGVAAHLLIGLDWQSALLLGAIVSSTDAAAVFSVLRRVPLPPRITGVLEAESGFNDAPAVILVVALSASEIAHVWALPLLMIAELAGGAALGIAVGWLGALALRRLALPASGLYPIAVLALTLVAYGSAAVVHASGFLAVYVAGVVLGNSKLPHGAATRGFAEGVGWLAQIGLFVMLGMIVNPSDLGPALLPGIGVGLALLLVARPASVHAALLPFRIPFREQAFIAWAGLRGAVPIVLATVPIVAGVDTHRRLFNVVFVLVVVFTLVEGPTLPLVARLLRVDRDVPSRDLEVESSPLERLDAALLQVSVPHQSRLHGVEIFELRLPRPAAITLIVRGGEAFVPSGQTVLRHGDDLLIVTTTAQRAAVERRLQAVSRRGRLAGWRPAPG